MQNSDKKTEILAPAGSMESMKAAIAGGADAVYLGAKNFNARSKADNFSREQLRLAVLYCHERGVRLYLTLNTLIKKSELQLAIEEVEACIDAGVDAFIIQDIGLYIELKKRFPFAVFHASTQMGVHNAYGALYAEKLGLERVILSRETLLSDIEDIKNKTHVEIEAFVHGAYCVSFSGNCYFSSLVSGYSGNRGKCLQLCRKKYTLSSGSKKMTGYVLSTKDICLLSELDKMKKAGVISFKIEGRLRSPEYAGVVSDVYKRALNGLTDSEDINRLKTVFNRGDFCSAYIKEDKPDIIYPVQQNNIGVRVGTVSGTQGRALNIRGGYKLAKGDGFKVLRNNREIGGAYESDGKIITKDAVKVGDEIRLTKSGAMEQWLKSRLKTSEKNKTAEPLLPLKSSTSNIVPSIDVVGVDLPKSCTLIYADETVNKKLLQMADYVIFSPSAYSVDIIKKFVAECKKPVLLDMPIEARGKDLKILEDIVKADIVSGYVANNIYALELCKNKPIMLGIGMNCLSSLIDLPRIMSVEAAYPDENTVVYAYGRNTLMQLTHCPKRVLGFKCAECKTCDGLTLTDELRNVFTLRRKRINYCYWELLNSKITDILPKLDKIKNAKILIDTRNVPVQRAEQALKEKYNISFNADETYGRYGKGVK